MARFKKMKKWARAGKAAERDFLSAALRLGFTLVSVTDPLKPMTVRLATRKEEAAKVDFIFTLSRDEHGWARRVVPLQLTIASSSNNKSLKAKRRMAQKGSIALFWTVDEIGQGESCALLKRAGEGDPVALEWFDEYLQNACDKFLGLGLVTQSVSVESRDNLELVDSGGPRTSAKCPSGHSGVLTRFLRPLGRRGGIIGSWFQCSEPYHKASAFPESVEQALEILGSSQAVAA